MENLNKPEIPQGYNWENNRNTSNEFNTIGKAKLDSIKDIILEIEGMVGERKTLSNKFINEGENMKTKIHNFLLENAPKGEDDSEFARERAELRKKQIEISELQLNEKIGCWRDISLLKKELRENTKELNEKENRTEMFEKILTD